MENSRKLANTAARLEQNKEEVAKQVSTPLTCICVTLYAKVEGVVSLLPALAPVPTSQTLQNLNLTSACLQHCCAFKLICEPYFLRILIAYLASTKRIRLQFILSSVFSNLRRVIKLLGLAMAEQNTTDKVHRYETFLNERLRGDLRKCLEQRDKIYEEQAEFLALRNSIQAIKTAELVPGEPLKTKVDLGCNFYCQVQDFIFL